MTTRPLYSDLHDLSEDDRIKQIGSAAALGNRVGVIVDDIPSKVKRYIDKVTKRYPSVQLLEQTQGPTPGVRTLAFGPRPN